VSSRDVLVSLDPSILVVSYCGRRCPSTSADQSLSAIPKTAPVYHASLRIHTEIRRLRTGRRAYMNVGEGVFYYDPCRCTVDITPRRCQQFKPKAGEVLKWTNTLAEGGDAVQSGQATADRWSLITLPNVTATEGKNRITITAGKEADAAL
jgi:hypothetical protein